MSGEKKKYYLLGVIPKLRHAMLELLTPTLSHISTQPTPKPSRHM